MINTSKILNDGTSPDPAKQQPYRYGRREGGRYAHVPYACLSQSQIDAIAHTCDLQGLNYEVENNHGSRAQITIEYPYNFADSSQPGATTEAEDLWEITPAKEFKDLLDSKNPLVLAMQSSSSGRQELALLKGWKRQNTLETNLTDGNGNYIQPVYPGTSTPFSQGGTILSKYIYDGVEQVEIAAPILTHTRTVTAQYINPAQFVNLGRVYSNATLISVESIPTAVLWDFPTDSDPSPVPIGSTGYYQTLLYGWLKNSPSVREIAMRKWNIVQTYVYGLYGVDLSGARL